MPFTTSESLLFILESGNIDEKQVALSYLLNAARNGTVFDVDRLVICLINADDVDTVQKIFVLLSHIAIRDDSCKRKLCTTSAIYHLVLKILASESVKEMIAVFYFLLAILHLDESADLSESLEEIKTAINEAKEKVRGMGILNQICALFLQSNSDSAIWQSLCQCLAECCTGTIQNQNESSHILPKCLQQLEGCFKLDLVNLVIALIYNNQINQERFILYGGIQCIARNFLNTHKGIELLCVSMTNYPRAVQEANMCNLVPQIEAIYAKSNVIHPSLNQVMLSKWCSLALWILAKSVPQNADDFNKLYKKPSDLIKHNKHSSEKVKKRLFQTQNSKISNDKENSTNTIGSSFLSKFDAINSFPSSPPNKIRPSNYNFNQVHPYIFKTSQENRGTQGKKLAIGWNMSVRRNNDKEILNFIPQSNGENSNKNIQSFIYNDVYDETNKENNSMFTNESFDETFQDFKPSFTSSPLQMKENVLKSDQGNKSIFKIPANPKRFEDEFHGQLLKSNSEEQIMYKNKAQSQIETIKNITASSKVRQLVQQVIDSQKKLQSINGDNNKNIVFYLTPEGWTSNGRRVLNKSQFEKGNTIGNDSNDNDKNANKILGFKILVEHNNDPTTTVRKEPELKKTIPDTSISNFVSAGNQTGFENPGPGFSGSNNVSIKSNKSNFMNPNSKNVIKRLKIGVSLYGCDFQKISNVLWSKKENVSAKFLQDVYCKHIVKNYKKTKVRKHSLS